MSPEATAMLFRGPATTGPDAPPRGPEPGIPVLRLAEGPFATVLARIGPQPAEADLPQLAEVEGEPEPQELPVDGEDPAEPQDTAAAPEEPVEGMQPAPGQRPGVMALVFATLAAARPSGAVLHLPERAASGRIERAPPPEAAIPADAAPLPGAAAPVPAEPVAARREPPAAMAAPAPEATRPTAMPGIVAPAANTVAPAPGRPAAPPDTGPASAAPPRAVLAAVPVVGAAIAEPAPIGREGGASPPPQPPAAMAPVFARPDGGATRPAAPTAPSAPDPAPAPAGREGQAPRLTPVAAPVRMPVPPQGAAPMPVAQPKPAAMVPPIAEVAGGLADAAAPSLSLAPPPTAQAAEAVRAQATGLAQTPAQQVAQSLAALPVRAGGGGMVINLAPAELGRVTIRLDPDPLNPVLHLTVERPETLDLMRRNLDLLEGALRDLGRGDCSIQLGGRGDGDAAGRRGPGAGPAQGSAGSFPDRSQFDDQPRDPRLAAGIGRLDLRL